MVKFLEVDPNEIENVRFTRRGRVSYPILKGFLETGMFLAKLDLTGVQQSKVALSSSLNAYIRSHNMPIKMFQRMGNFYLMRLDVDEDGNAIPDWAEQQLKEHIESKQPMNAEVLPIDTVEISKRYAAEKGQSTK